MPGIKPSQAELQRRVAIVSDLLARKYKRSEIYEYIRNETEWNVTHSTMYTYINKAKAEIAKAVQRNAWQNLAESITDMRYLYRQALESGDIRTALAVRKEMNGVLAVSMESVAPTDVTERDEQMSDEIEGMLTDISPMRQRKA